MTRWRTKRPPKNKLSSLLTRARPHEDVYVRERINHNISYEIKSTSTIREKYACTENTSCEDEVAPSRVKLLQSRLYCSGSQTFSLYRPLKKKNDRRHPLPPLKAKLSVKKYATKN